MDFFTNSNFTEFLLDFFKQPNLSAVAQPQALLGYFFMSVTTYDFFHRLTNLKGSEDGVLSKFSLFGFVIYDPIEHADLKNYLEVNYDHLDQISGSSFLFFSVIQLEEEQENYFKDRPYYNRVKELSEDLSGLSNPVKTKNAESMAFALAAHLEIDLKHLPVIVVSKDLAFGHMEVIPINVENIEDKLYKLGSIARFKLKNTRDEEFKELLIKHGVIEEDLFISSSAVNIGKALYNVTGSYELLNKNHAAQVHIEELLKTLKQEVFNYSSLNDQENLDKSLLKLAAVLATISVDQDKSLKLDLIKDWQSSTTKMYLKSYQAIPKTLDITDFSPLAINLAKSFENEMVLSYYNWLRNQVGIPMPEFYNKPYQKESIFFKNGKYNLNDYRKNPFELRPLPLGIILTCLKEVGKDSNQLNALFTTMDNGGQHEYLLKTYFEINDIRNKVAHPNHIFTEQDLAELEQKISAVFNGRSGEQIRDLKRALPGEIQP